VIHTAGIATLGGDGDTVHLHPGTLRGRHLMLVIDGLHLLRIGGLHLLLTDGLHLLRIGGLHLHVCTARLVQLARERCHCFFLAVGHGQLACG
jgi:hypothetical protein